MTTNTISPAIVAQGSTVTISTKVVAGSTSYTNARVGYYIAPANDFGSDNNIAQENKIVNIAANSQTTHTFTATIPANAPLGSYWLTVITWENNWNNIYWATNQFTLSVVRGSASITFNSLSPTSKFQGATQTVTASFVVNLAATGVSNGFIGFYIAPASDDSQRIAEGWANGGQTLAPGSTTTFTLSAQVSASAPVGSYVLYAGVWDANWNGIVYLGGVSSYTVRTSTPYLGPFSSSASSVKRGNSVTITMGATAGSSTLSNPYIGFSIVRISNDQVIVSNQVAVTSIAAGTTHTRSFSATIPSNAATGSYRVTFGFWNSNWDTLDWNNEGLFLTVTN